MKGRCTLLFVLLFTVATALGDYKLSWSTIDGGGGRSSGGFVGGDILGQW